MTKSRKSKKKTEISYSFFKSEFGVCLVASTAIGVCAVLFADSQAKALDDLRSIVPYALLYKSIAPSHLQIQKYFEGKISFSKIKLDLFGTEFQISVWQVLQTIPKGVTSTYAEIAKLIGKPKAVRAVGSAIGKNMIGLIIPCHRVLRTDGGIGGFRWGVERKRAMLKKESKKK